MLNKISLRTEISRGSGDYFPSIFEIFHRHFSDTPLFVYQTGITDRYHDYDDDDDDDMVPSLGLDYLETEVNNFYTLLSTSDVFKTWKENIVTYRYANHENNTFICILVVKDKQIAIQIRISPARRRTMTSFGIFAEDHNGEGIAELKEYAKRFIAPVPTKKDKIHIITQSGNDFYLKDIPLSTKRSRFSYKNYNEDFEGISTRIIKTLTENNESGLVLFHGDPGTGKTSYLKHLLHTIANKKLIYMPPDLTEHLSSPGFITFMMSEAINSILLIEDAENVLRHREAGGNQAVSNILNLSDGILGDVLKLQIVCTFNSKLDEIDPALLRPGRCIAEYRFEKLVADRAGNLLADLHGDDVEWEPRDMTLAEVFNYKKPKDRSKNKKRSVGFIDTNEGL